MAEVVKRRGHTEEFDERKVYGSIYAACASAGRDEDACERIADEVSTEIRERAESADALPTDEIRDIVSDELAERDEELSFYYEKHLPDLDNL
ncbi:MAG: ATP cone domain-containing protein [Candidatus Nanohaloarchaea archaeon]|nr:ATP cone domain-containing protein [Candidatus Nanohaloarchaea archaeon]